jgi:hypothetical protein
VLIALGSNEPRGAAPMLELLDFATGNEGKGPVGGAIDGRAGRGSELPDILTALTRVCDSYCSFWSVLAMHCWPDRLSFFLCSIPPRTYPSLSSVVTRTQITYATSVLRKPPYDFLGRAALDASVSLRQAGTWAREASVSVSRVVAVGTVVWRLSLIVGGTRHKRGGRVM